MTLLVMVGTRMCYSIVLNQHVLALPCEDVLRYLVTLTNVDVYSLTENAVL